jgi:class 3 adenylate cyclase/tRNA A-37 threonylcarbamoyl transferase component Bud32
VGQTIAFCRLSIPEAAVCAQTTPDRRQTAIACPHREYNRYSRRRCITPPQPDPEQQETVTARRATCVGDLLSGRYRVERELGSGGFGTVYLAHDEKLVSKPVVVKVLNHLTADAWALRKFRQEIEALARIDHPGVVAVFDEGQTDQGAPFLVMQFVDGATLRRLIKPGGMSLRTAAAIVRQIGSALGAAHAKGVYHRDLKPENIMVQSPESEPRVKLIDFGIAGIKDSLFAGDQSTRIAGTYRYMPPEQLEGNVVAESDIYAFGAIAYEMLTGQSAVKSPLELVAMKAGGLKVKPRDLRPELPIAAQNVILKALAFEISERYTSAHDMGDQLADALDSAGPRAATPATEATRATVAPADRLEIAHVLFLDLVGFSTLAMEEQRTLLDALQSMVRATASFTQAERAGELIALPTGDGMALVFFANPVAAAECAVEIARAARANPAIRLRTGLHSGPVYRVADINKNLNVTGGGINMAQRVMDAGDAGHILLSGTLAETLLQLGAWKDRLSHLGEHAVKYGAMMRFYNLCTEDAGNATWPSKWKQATPPPPPKSRRGVMIGALAIAALAGTGIYVATRPKEPPPKPPVLHTARLEYSIDLIPAGQTEVRRRASEAASYRAGDNVAVNVKSAEHGFLYILNDGPLPDGRPSIAVLRPAPDVSAELAGAQIFTTPYNQFDKAAGNEDTFLVWSGKPIPYLDEIRNLKQFRVDPTGSGAEGQIVITDTARLTALRDFLSKRVEPSGIKRDEDANISTVSTTSDILIHRIRLHHD